MIPRLLDINTEFFGPDDRRDDRAYFFDCLSALGRATRAADTQYYVTTAESFEVCASFMMGLMRSTDFLKIQDVGEGDFFIMNAPQDVEAQLLDAEALEIIRISSPSNTMLALKRQRSAVVRERIRKALSAAYERQSSGALDQVAYVRPRRLGA